MAQIGERNEDRMHIWPFEHNHINPSHPLRIVSHRGGAGFGPENTLESLRGAIAAGVHMVETDVRATADGELVIHHDPTVNSKRIADTELHELRTLHPDIPTLREYLELARGRCLLDLEAKALDIHVLARAVKEFSDPEQVIVTSFNYSLLVALKEEYPEFAVGWVIRLHREKEEAVVLASATHMRLVLPRQGLVDEEFVSSAHAAGLLVYTWTVNHVPNLRRLVGKGIDGVITDKYFTMVEAWEEMRAAATVLEEAPAPEAVS